MTRYRLLWAGLVLGGAIAYACTTDTAIGPDASLDSLYIEPAAAPTVLDDRLHLPAVGVDTAGRRFALTRVTWSSTDPAVSFTPTGAVVGIALGTATVHVAAGAITATATVTVTPKPIFGTSADTVLFSAFANGPDPAAQTLTITNAGGGTLAPVVDSIHYVTGAGGWLQAAIATGAGTDTLSLAPATSTLAVGAYVATVFLGAPKATQKPITVKLTMTVDAPFAMAIDSGDAQPATVNTAGRIKPTVVGPDRFNNPVPGAAVTFSVTGGGGPVNPVTGVATDPAGQARATSWALRAPPGADPRP